MELHHEQTSIAPPQGRPLTDGGLLRRVESRIISGYAAYARSRVARVIARPLIALLCALLVWLKVEQLGSFLGSSAADGGMAATFAFWSVALYYALGLVFLVLALVLFVVRRPARQLVQRVVGIAVALAGTFLPSWLIFDPARSVTATLAPLASVFLVGGMAFAAWALLILGRCFSIMPEVRGLVRRGPYRLVRHPVYLGEILATFGVLLPILSPRNVAIFAAFCALQLWRTRYEEDVLAAVYPEYADYRRTTKRLIPGVV